MSQAQVQPGVLTTGRLRLRPLAPEDVPAITRLAGERAIADTTITVPHPYTAEHALELVRKQREGAANGTTVGFGIERKTDGALIGAITLRAIDREHEEAELSFWVGKDHWRCGYATEAARALLDFAFAHLGLNRVHAHHMVRNPASGRVLQKAGLRPEGLLRQRVKKWGVFEDVVILAMLRADWAGTHSC